MSPVTVALFEQMYGSLEKVTYCTNRSSVVTM